MAVQIYNPKFRNMTLEEIEKEINFNKNWLPYGYWRRWYNNDLATYFVSRGEESDKIYEW